MAGALVRFAETFWTGMLVHLWQTTLVLGFLWLLSRALRNAPARLQTALWWIGVFKLLLPLSWLAPLASRLTTTLVDRFGPGPVSTQVEWISATVWLYPVTFQASAERPAPSIGLLYPVLLLLWFAGLGWILARRLRRSRQQIRLPWIDPGHRGERLEVKLRQALATTGIPRPSVLLVQGSGIPAVRGLLRPFIELPAQVAERLALRDLTAVLLHEAEHCRRRDPLRRLLAALASWLFFFYPPVRWLLRRVHETTEMACDEAALRRGIPPRDYARSIARTLELGLGTADTQPAFLGLGHSSLRRRLERLNRERRYRTMLAHRIILVIAALIALLGSVVPLTSGTQAAPESHSAAVTAVRFAALDGLDGASTEVTLAFEQTPVATVLEAISKVAAFKLELDPSVREKTVSISIERGTVREALIEVAELAGLHYEVPGASTLRVRHILLPGKDGVTSPVRIETSVVQPRYPEEMREAKHQGRAILQAVIDSSGFVRDVEVLKTDDPTFSASAIAAIEQWRYEPATLNGEPVSVYFTIVVEFKLNGDKPKPESEGGETL